MTERKAAAHKRLHLDWDRVRKQRERFWRAEREKAEIRRKQAALASAVRKAREET